MCDQLSQDDCVVHELSRLNVERLFDSLAWRTPLDVNVVDGLRWNREYGKGRPVLVLIAQSVELIQKAGLAIGSIERLDSLN
jgi:hypothetical protein